MNKQHPHIHIVLVHPKMPSNTGNIIRLCANTGASLHLLKPLGFDLDDKKLRRAGLDYHEYAHLKIYDDWQSLKIALEQLHCQHIVALTTKFSRTFYDYDFRRSVDGTVTDSTETHDKNIANIALVFGSETDGLPAYIREDIANNNISNNNLSNHNPNSNDFSKNNVSTSNVCKGNPSNNSGNWLRLPMLPNSRSLNLSNSVAICLYEVWRQLEFYGDTGESIGYDQPNQS